MNECVFWVLICMVLLTVCSCHVTYAFQSESTLSSSLSIKELLAQSRREIGSLSDYNWTWIQNHLVRKRLSCDLSTYLYGALDRVFLSCHVRSSEWIHTQEFLDIQATTECGFTLKRVRDMTRTHRRITLFLSKEIVVTIIFVSKCLWISQ